MMAIVDLGSRQRNALGKVPGGGAWGRGRVLRTRVGAPLPLLPCPFGQTAFPAKLRPTAGGKGRVAESLGRVTEKPRQGAGIRPKVNGRTPHRC